MMKTKIEKTGTYAAVDATGNKYLISIFTTFTDCTSLEDTQQQWLPCGESHQMQNGNHINVSDDGTLTDVRTGLVMRRA